MSIINSINRQLTQPAIIDMNAAVDLDGREPADVARQFLLERGLVRS